MQTTTRRTALATELLAQIRAYRALSGRVAEQEQAIRATWAALQACEAEPRAPGAGRREA